MKSSKIQARHWKRLPFETLANQIKFGETSDADESVKKLVFAMSALDDIVTLSSCGGHCDADDEHGQFKKGNFIVIFFVKPTLMGFRSLGTIVEAAGNTDRENTSVIVDNMTDNPDFISFELHGSKGACPDTLAEEIKSLNKIFKNPPGKWASLSKGYTAKRGR